MSGHPTAFNARNISPKDIATNFIVPEDFKKIAAYQNLVLVGPRGIGKTTLMKVLTPSGLHYLSKRNDLKELFKELDLEYIPIYIPAETLWKGNATLINKTFKDDASRYHIMNGLFVDHCLHEVVGSIEDSRNIAANYNDERPYWALAISETQEEKICRLSSRIWKLATIETSFIGLKLAILERSNVYRSAINSLNPEIARADALGQDSLDVLIMLKGFFDIVDTVLGEKKWSVNFDEMEIAPKRVLTNLYENLRSFDHRAVLKFSLFPYIDFYNIEERMAESGTSPVEGQDFRAINLTNKFADPDYSFARELVKLECTKRNVDNFDFVSYLNSSRAIKRGTRLFKYDGFERNFAHMFADAKQSKIDKDFLLFMSKKGLTEKADIDKLSGNERAQHARKIAPIVEFRSYYLTEKTRIDNGIRRRSVKGYGYYHGFDQMLSLTESNPRAINFYVNDLLDSMLSGEQSSSAQNRAIGRNVNRFRALVATQAVPMEHSHLTGLNALNIVDRLAANLSIELLDKKFRSEPALSYVFRGIDQATKSMLGIAINTGAIVVDQRQEGRQLIFEVEHCRARVSHRLGPFYPLPTITGQERVLKRIPDGRAEIDDQQDLLDLV